MDKKQDAPNENSLTTKNASEIAPGEIVIGELLSFDDVGRPLVTFTACNQDSVFALSTVAVTHEHKGRQVALLFADGDLSKPVIMGLIHNPLFDILDNIEVLERTPESEENPFENVQNINSNVKDGSDKKSENSAYIDGQKVVIEGHEEIELRCGEASIRLTKAGKILIKGKYLLNRSSGVNRIMGGSVQVN